MRLHAIAAIALIFAASGAAQGQDGARLALVIWNEDYPVGVGRLQEPSESAAAIAGALEQAGFTVVRANDLDRRALNRQVRAFADRLTAAGPGAAGFFYYAGHGASAPVLGAQPGEQRWVNYLVPAQTPIANVDDLRDEGVGLDAIVARLETGARASGAHLFVVVDACRDLPFSIEGRSINQRGFGPVATAAQSTLIAYSTPNGETAPDTDVYAQTLAQAILAPERSAYDAFRAAHRDVAAARASFQQPLLRGDPGDAFCFMSCPAAADDIAWRFAQQTNTAQAYGVFLEIYPDSRHAPEARARLAALGPDPEPALDPAGALWAVFGGGTDPRPLEQLIRDHPDSPYAAMARDRLAELAASAAAPVAAGRVEVAELLVYRGHRDDPSTEDFVESVVTSVAFSPDGRRALTGSWDTTARVWDAATGAELAVLSGHEGGVWSVAFSPDGGRVLTGSDDNTARVWDAVTGAEIAVLRGHGERVMSVAFSPDGGRVLTGSWDNTARLWDAATGAEIAVLSGHGGYVRSVAFSPDGGRALTGSTDGTARIWRIGAQ